MVLSTLPTWIWPALAGLAALIYLYRQRPFNGPRPSPVVPADAWQQLQTEIIRGVLAKQGLLPPVTAPTSPRVIELPGRFVIVPVEEGTS
jgi:hypothetical protein